MTNLGEQALNLRDQALSLATECLKANNLNVFQGLNGVAIELTRIAQHLSNGENPSDSPDSPFVVTEPMPYKAIPSTNEVPIFRVYKGTRYEAILNITRMQRLGHGDPCVNYKGKWMAASATAHEITKTSVNGWRHFWRYTDSQSRERAIEDIRGARHRE